MNNRTHRPTRAGIATLALACLLAGSTGEAEGGLTFDVSLDTSQLVANAIEGPFSLDFTLIGNQGNTVTISNIQFGPGGPAGSPALTNGASGDLASGVTMTSSASGPIFNDFNQQFTPGDVVTFQVSTTLLDDGVNPPDNFSFSILTFDGLQIPTTDVASSTLLSVDLAGDAAGSIRTFSADPNQFFSDGNPVFPLPAPTFTIAPEPSTLLLTAVGLAAFAASRRRRP